MATQSVSALRRHEADYVNLGKTVGCSRIRQ